MQKSLRLPPRTPRFFFPSSMIKLSSPTLAEHPKAELGPDVTVALPAYGDYATTLTALQSLFLSAEGDFEVLLVDNGSPDESLRTLLRQVQAEHRNTTVFSFPENRQYSGAMNAILSHARGEWIVGLANDIFVTPYFFRELLAVAKSNPRYGIVRGCSNFVDNGKATHNIPLARPPVSFEELFSLGRQAAEKFPAEPLVDEFFVGDAFVVPRALLERIGTYDPQFFGYFADPDFGLRTQIAGFDQILARRAFAYHKQNANFDCLPPPVRQEKIAERWKLVFENWSRFKAKYGLPAHLEYTSTHDIPWAKLAAQTFDPARHFVPPGNYLAERW